VTTSTPETLEGPAAVSNQRDRMIAGVSAVLLLIGMPVGWLTDNPSTGDVIGMIVAIIIDLAVMTALFVRLLPRERAATHRTARTVLIMGILSILLGLVFWTGLAIAVGAATVALGLTVRDRGRDGRAMTGLVLGAIAVVASFVLLLIG
jgi:uncharacterized membrane protein HdeD (DUF308 family)